jgi:hypothetical protein
MPTLPWSSLHIVVQQIKHLFFILEINIWNLQQNVAILTEKVCGFPASPYKYKINSLE